MLRRYNCSTVRDMLPLHVGGDLDPRHTGPVDEHLHACLGCFREFRELATMRGRLGVLAEEPLPEGVLDGFTEEVMARIAVGEPGPAAEPPRPSLLRLPSVRLAAAAVLLLALSLAVTLGGDEPGPGPVGSSPLLADGGSRKEHGWPAPSLTDIGGRSQPGMQNASTGNSGNDSTLYGLPMLLEVRDQSELQDVLEYLQNRPGSQGHRRVLNPGLDLGGQRQSPGGLTTTRIELVER